MIAKKTKKSICTILVAMMLTISVPMPAQALAAGATYTAFEIISMIFAVVGGTTIQQSQGIVGGSSFDANSLYETMNNQSAGIGSLLSSYVNRAQYLSPGSDLVISDADYQAFLEYFKNYNIANHTSTISLTDKSSIEQYISQQMGKTVTIPGEAMNKIVNGYSNIMFAYQLKPGTYERGNKTCIIYNPAIGFELTAGYLDRYYDLTFNYAEWLCIWDGTVFEVMPGSQGMTLYFEYPEIVQIAGGTSFNKDTVANGKIKNGTYDTVSKSRTWDPAQGKLVGHTTITMPATETIDEAINSENVKEVTDAVNVYPVDTADNSMVYYPTQSAEDFIVPEMTVQTNVSVEFPAIEGEAAFYTMDLTSFFPFCIPFDIYAFLQAFEADPEAPSITYNFPYVDNNGNVVYIEQTFNLSQFDGIAQLVRRLELVAFIVGLAFVTRSFFLRG